MQVINLWAGPGAGKSTLAAEVFVDLKRKGAKVELVTEFAKELVWAKRFDCLDDQAYVTGTQHHRLWALKGRVDYVVTDSPLPLGIFYGGGAMPGFEAFVTHLFRQYDNRNFFVFRGGRTYRPHGRGQSEDRAKALDVEIRQWLDHNEPYKPAVNVGHVVNGLF